MAWSQPAENTLENKTIPPHLKEIQRNHPFNMSLYLHIVASTCHFIVFKILNASVHFKTQGFEEQQLALQHIYLPCLPLLSVIQKYIQIFL